VIEKPWAWAGAGAAAIAPKPMKAAMKAKKIRRMDIVLVLVGGVLAETPGYAEPGPTLRWKDENLVN